MSRKESELVALMDQNGIGTDASIPQHVQRLGDRQAGMGLGCKPIEDRQRKRQRSRSSDCLTRHTIVGTWYVNSWFCFGLLVLEHLTGVYASVACHVSSVLEQAFTVHCVYGLKDSLHVNQPSLPPRRRKTGYQACKPSKLDIGPPNAGTSFSLTALV